MILTGALARLLKTRYFRALEAKHAAAALPRTRILGGVFVTTNTIHSIALTLQELGSEDEAVLASQGALQIPENVCGRKKHLVYAPSLNGLARMLGNHVHTAICLTEMGGTRSPEDPIVKDARDLVVESANEVGENM